LEQETILTYGRVVTRSEVFQGTVHLKAGRIADVSREISALPGAVNMENDLLLPGLVDLHTDNFERAIEPRTGARLPGPAAMAAHDRETASAGVTTVFDALCLTDANDDPGRMASLREGLAALVGLSDSLKAEHFLHLRVELPADGIVAAFQALRAHPRLRLVSLMDHTPGQKQFADIEAWRALPWNRRRGAEELAAIERHYAEGAARVAPNRAAILAALAGSGIALASHDDRTEAHIAEAVESGIRIAEFPVTFAAARAARAAGMAILGGAPNVLRGGSHSGNIAVAGLAAEGLLDALAADYVPAAMLDGALLLHHRHGLALPEAVAMVTATPAALVGLTDRGSIAPGQRADLVRVHWHQAGTAIVRGVWREGGRIA
jgi:alpha-D-ribose 1-methylphosphonate 5-triphosphate diphosphatase